MSCASGIAFNLTCYLKARTRLPYVDRPSTSAMISLLQLSNELLLLISTKLTYGEDLSHLLQVNHRLYTLLLPRLYQQNVKTSRCQGLLKCAADGNERGVRHFLYWGAYVDVQSMFSRRGQRAWSLPGAWLGVLPYMLQTSRRTPLGVAVGAGHDAIVALLLNHGAKLDDSEEQQKWSQLDYPAVSALLAGHESTLALLLEWGAQTEGPNLLFGGLINCAVASGQMPMLKLLIKFGVDLNIEVNGVYPLNWAVRRIPNYASMVEVLLDNGADIALVDDDKGHLLREAIGYGTIETLHLLLKRGVSYHESLFNFAINKCTVETVRLLLDYGARIEFESVVCAVRSRNCDILELLIDHGFDLNGRDSNGCTILHRAVCREPPFKTRTICGLSANSRVSLFPKRSSPLHVAAYCRRRRDERSTTEEIVKCLIRRGADVNARARQRQTPLYWAWKYASPAVQQLLLENGADWTDMLTIY